MKFHVIENSQNEKIADRFTPEGTTHVIREGDAYFAYFPYNRKVGGTVAELDPDKVVPIIGGFPPRADVDMSGIHAEEDVSG